MEGAGFRGPQTLVLHESSSMFMAVIIYVESDIFKHFCVNSPIQSSPPPCKEVLCPHFKEEQREAWRGCGKRFCCLHLQYLGSFTAPDLPLHTPWASSCLQSLQTPSHLIGQLFLTLEKEDWSYVPSL